MINLIMCVHFKKGKFKNVKIIDYEKEYYQKKKLNK